MTISAKDSIMKEIFKVGGFVNKRGILDMTTGPFFKKILVSSALETTIRGRENGSTCIVSG